MMLVQNVGMEIYFASKRSLLAAPYTGRKECEIRSYDTHRCKECNKIEGHVQQCKRLVLQYIPLIMVNGEKFLEKNDVCALVQACPASQKTTISSFLDEGLVSDA